MDIFTTAYIRRVRLPVKPAKLKVKALFKEPATAKLTEDLDHLEDHDQYSTDVRQQQGDRQTNEPSDSSIANENNTDAEENPEANKGKSDHQIDLFI